MVVVPPFDNFYDKYEYNRLSLNPLAITSPHKTKPNNDLANMLVSTLQNIG